MDEDHLDNSAIEALPPLKDLVASLDMRARKSLGQNFLFDLNLTRRIARSAASLNGTTIEVGPGPGGLTRALLPGCAGIRSATSRWNISVIDSNACTWPSHWINSVVAML